MAEIPSGPLEITISPRQARKQLKRMGVPKSDWDGIMSGEKTTASQHFDRALIDIGRGKKRANLWKKYQRYQPEARDR